MKEQMQKSENQLVSAAKVPQQNSLFDANDFYDYEPTSFTGSYIIVKSPKGPLKAKPLPRCYSDTIIVPCQFEKTKTNKVIEGMKKFRCEEIASYPSIEGKPYAEDITAEGWFTPLLVALFALYSAAMSANKKSLINEIKYIFKPNMLSSSYENDSDNGIQNYVLLFSLSMISFALFAFFAVQGLHGRIYANHLQSLLTFLAILGAFTLIKFVILRLVCYVFYDFKTQNKVTRLFMLQYSLLGLGLAPSLLMLAYSPSWIQPFAIILGLIVYISLTLAYLQKLISFFFDGILSIFYLILYLCTVEILPLVGLFIGLANIY